MTEHELIVWGGDDPRRERHLQRAAVRHSTMTSPMRGGVLDLDTRRWRAMSADGQPRGGRTSDLSSAITLGEPFLAPLMPASRSVIVCAPTASSSECARYDLDADRWLRMAQMPFPLRAACTAALGGTSLACPNGGSLFVYVVADDVWREINVASEARRLGLGDATIQTVVSAGPSTRVFVRARDSAESLRGASFSLVRHQAGALGVVQEATWPARYIDAFNAPLGKLDAHFVAAANTLFGHACDAHDARGCVEGFQITRARDGDYECWTTIGRSGPTLALVGDGIAGFPRCGTWSSNGIACAGERVMYDNPTYTFKTLASDGFACTWDAQGPTCSRFVTEGQPSLRRHAGYAIGNDTVYVFGGRSTVMDATQCLLGPREGCGIAVDGPLLGDGYSLRIAHSSLRSIVVNACYGNCTPSVDADGYCEVPEALPFTEVP